MARTATPPELSISELKNMLARRERDLNKLFRQRESLEKKMAAVNVEIGKMDGALGGRGGGRVRNERSLVEVMDDVLGKVGKPMKVADIADAVLATGYLSNAANFRVIVNQMLIKDKRFTSPSRGLYQVKVK